MQVKDIIPIKNAINEGEIDPNVVCANFAHTTRHGALEGKEQQHEIVCYNLDVIISVGYRVHSQRGVEFRRWATGVLKDYLIRGVAINRKRLQQLGQAIEVMKRGFASWEVAANTVAEPPKQLKGNRLPVKGRGAGPKGETSRP